MATNTDVQCPICSKPLKNSEINEHIDECLNSKAEPTDQDVILEKCENRIVNRKRKSDSPDKSGWGFLKAANSDSNIQMSKKNRRNDHNAKSVHDPIDKNKKLVTIISDDEKKVLAENADSVNPISLGFSPSNKQLTAPIRSPKRGDKKDQSIHTNIDPFKPLAEQMRPTCFEDYIGHDKEVGGHTMLGSLLQNDKVPSMVLWGPPGCGKVIIRKNTFEPRYEISNNVVCATSKGSDQPAHVRSLIGAFASHLNTVELQLLEL